MAGEFTVRKPFGRREAVDVLSRFFSRKDDHVQLEKDRLGRCKVIHPVARCKFCNWAAFGRIRVCTGDDTLSPVRDIFCAGNCPAVCVRRDPVDLEELTNGRL
jgi:hypothetical protein